MDEVIRSISDQKLLSQIERVIPFHGYLSTGAFVGIQIFNIAKRELGFSEGERLFVICETFGCMPDAFQVLGGCTIGNRGLLIEDRGKMAATFSRRASAGANRVQGVRVFLDPARTASYPRLHSWYMKAEKVPHQEAISELLRAGDGVYTCKAVTVEVAEKPLKRTAICEGCGESFILRGDERLCRSCSEIKQEGEPTRKN